MYKYGGLRGRKLNFGSVFDQTVFGYLQITSLTPQAELIWNIKMPGPQMKPEFFVCLIKEKGLLLAKGVFVLPLSVLEELFNNADLDSRSR